MDMNWEKYQWIAKRNALKNARNADEIFHALEVCYMPVVRRVRKSFSGVSLVHRPPDYDYLADDFFSEERTYYVANGAVAHQLFKVFSGDEFADALRASPRDALVKLWKRAIEIAHAMGKSYCKGLQRLSTLLRDVLLQRARLDLETARNADHILGAVSIWHDWIQLRCGYGSLIDTEGARSLYRELARSLFDGETSEGFTTALRASDHESVTKLKRELYAISQAVGDPPSEGLERLRTIIS